MLSLTRVAEQNSNVLYDKLKNKLKIPYENQANPFIQLKQKIYSVYRGRALRSPTSKVANCAQRHTVKETCLWDRKFGAPTLDS